MPDPAENPPARRAHGYVPLVEVWRGDVVESVHYGAIAVADAEGRLVAAAGDPGEVTFLRSAAKPAQALALVESGAVERFGLAEREIAVIIGSHGGEPFHLEAVRSILAKIGLSEEALQCGAHAPFHKPSARALRAACAAPTPLHNNCSGKHAGMLALAVHLGSPVASYLDPGHPVQARIRVLVEDLAGLPEGGARIAIDGCSAPTFAMPLRAAALLYARLVAADGPRARNGAGGRESRDAAARVVRAMRGHPEMVGGTGRLCTVLLRAAPERSLVAKIGAEGFYALGYVRDGAAFGIALKIADGDGERARTSAALAALRQLGVLGADEAEGLKARFVGPIRNRRGLEVGRVSTAFELRPAGG
jgi:L-asparaginase II